MNDALLVVLCTTPSIEVAEKLARAIVEQRLAACANIVPTIRSLYMWNGALHDEPETLMVLKTHPNRYEALETWLKANHPYDVPEIVALPVSHGSAPYIAWVTQQTK